ncbi:MAG: NAD-dependent epimerase/dehydratase family protein [Acidobacteriota bacterium]|nr:NAD-dependent epimerase/dehydratase family protein [Acidobacteriota bacterium]
MPRYFVTGATGFLGGELTKQLIGRGHRVAALVRTPGKAQLLRTLGVELHEGDITDRESLRASMAGVDGLFHCAAWYKVGEADNGIAERVNVGGTRNVLETMRELEIPKGVYTSTVAVFSDTKGEVPDETYRYDGPHLSEYDRTKWLAHYDVALPLMAGGLPLVVVMPGVIYGPGDTSGLHAALVDLLRKRLYFTPRRTAYCWAHVEDTARAHILAMERGRSGEAYIITGPRHSFEHAFDLIASLAGVRPAVLHPGPRMLRSAAWLMEQLNGAVELPAMLTPEALRVMAGVTYFGSSDKAARELEFTARPLAEGMEQTLEHELRELQRDRPTP